MTLNAPADFETKPSYSINVIATDGGNLFDTKAVTISVTDFAIQQGPQTYPSPTAAAGTLRAISRRRRQTAMR